MPYRRLPNTDNARIRALRRAIEKCNTLEGKTVLQADVIGLRTLLRNFEAAQSYYLTALSTQVESNKKLQLLIKNARLYVSHFIQVLNLSVIRKEIKKSTKTLYALEPDEHNVPDLNTNESLLQWGQNVINGEQARLAQGGTPIYNPSIARVKVDFAQFKEAYISQKLYQTNTQRQLDLLSGQRADMDNVLRDLWNQIEAKFEDLPRMEKLEKCKDYGLVYYVRNRKKSKIDEYSEDY